MSAYRQLSPHFDESEFACHHCGEVRVDPELVEGLERLRTLAGNRPVNVLSGYRCATHNKLVGGAPQSQHLLGKAADVQVRGLSPVRVAELAAQAGFRGIGLYDTFTHVDVRERPARWDNRHKRGEGR